MAFSKTLFVLILATALAGCQVITLDNLTSSGSSGSRYRCSDGVTLSLQRVGSSVTASDSRGFSASLPASPPGQTSRYAEGIYALIIEGSGATWFVSGQKPAVCQR